MSTIQYIYDDEDPERVIAYVLPASTELVQRVLNAPEMGDDGRSPWVWVRLPNGDLILGVYPRGDTYFAVEREAP